MQFNHRNSLAHERRESSRFGRMPDDDFAALWTPQGEPQLAEVHDESLGGISLVLDMNCGIGLGQRVTIVYAGAYFDAIARHLETLSADKLVIGFACEPLTTQDDTLL